MPPLFREFTPEQIDKLKELRSEHRKQYSAYGLTENPFPLGGNFPEGYLQYTLLTEDQEKEIERFLVSTFFRQEFQGLLILGEYGSGKSHLLRYIFETINADEHNVFEGFVRAFMIGNPMVSPDAILLRMLDEIGLSTIQELIFLPIREKLTEEYQHRPLGFLGDFCGFTGDVDFWSQQNYKPSVFANLFATGYRQFLRTLTNTKQKLDIQYMKVYARQVLLDRISGNPIIVDSLLNLMFQSEVKDVRSWESFLSSSFAGRRGQVVGVEYYLEAILNLFIESKYQHVYLLVDEVEDLRTSGISQRALVNYLNALRRMIQHNYKRFSFVLASTRDAWNDIMEVYTPIADRFPIQLDLTSTSGHTKSVVANYLRLSRTEDTCQGPPWHPFSEEAVDKLVALRGNVLRHVLTECRRLIDLGLELQTPPPLSADFVAEHVPHSVY